MNFSFVSDSLNTIKGDLLALCAFEGQLTQTRTFTDLDRQCDGLLLDIAEGEGFKAKEDQTLLVHTKGRLPVARVILVGLGKREDFQPPDSRKYAAVAAREARDRGCGDLVLTLPPLDPTAQEQAVQFMVEGVHLGLYTFEAYKNDEDHDRVDRRLHTVALALPEEWVGAERVGPFNLALARGEAIAESVNWARNLVNEPASVMTPARLADLAQELVRDTVTCKVLGPREIEKQKMRLLLAVAQGSDNEPRFIHLTYRPKGKDKPKKRFVMVGKGVTFDSGGLSLKPTDSMEHMKVDMAGGAAVLGAFRTLASLGLKSEVHALVPAAENMVSGSSYRVGDIVTGMAGKSVEIKNTDAEGRLLLADALAYACKLQPDEVIDLATLTGACVVALGEELAGVMGNDRAMVERFLASARRVGEEVWPLPLPRRYNEHIKSPVADLKNVGPRWGGVLTAGLFLKQFVDTSSWVHVDIAGPALAEKTRGHVIKGGTGFGVLSLVEYLRGQDN